MIMNILIATLRCFCEKTPSLSGNIVKVDIVRAFTCTFAVYNGDNLFTQ